MSQWTHVTGTIRLDWVGFIFGNEFPKEQLSAILGTPCGYKNYNEYATGSAKLPLGSEGSLQWRFVVTQDSPNSLSYGLIYIWGDLRDYDDVDEVYTWLSNFHEQLVFDMGIIIRNAVVHVNVEFNNDYDYVIYYRSDDEKGEFVKKELL